MKWPKEIVIFRHGESEFNLLKKKREEDKKYQVFRKRLDNELALAKDDKWASKELVRMARGIWLRASLRVSDYDTPLTQNGFEQAVKTGEGLRRAVFRVPTNFQFPKVIYVSPYLRTKQTLQGIIIGFPELGKVPVVFEERVREQDHGLSTLYNDWRVYYALNPAQALISKLEGKYSYRFLNGENKPDVRERVRSFISTLIRENAGQVVWVVSHHITLLSILANLGRWDRERFILEDENNKPVNCGVTKYVGDPNQGESGKIILAIYNQKFY